jgi:hypothetical protein
MKKQVLWQGKFIDCHNRFCHHVHPPDNGIFRVVAWRDTDICMEGVYVERLYYNKLDEERWVEINKDSMGFLCLWAAIVSRAIINLGWEEQNEL